MNWHGNLLYVRDLDASVAFYSEALSIEVVARPAPHIAVLGLDNGLLYLHQDPDDAPEWMRAALDSNHRGVGVICHFEVESMADLKERLALAEVEVSHGPVEAHGQLQLYLYDPDGYNLVFVEQLTGQPGLSA